MTKNEQTNTGKILTVVSKVSLTVLLVAVLCAIGDAIFFGEQYREIIQPIGFVGLAMFAISVALILLLRKRL